MVHWKSSNGPTAMVGEDMCERAAWYGQLNILQWAHANGYFWDVATCDQAALGYSKMGSSTWLQLGRTYVF